MLIEADPEVFHSTPHYNDYPAVLARLGCLEEVRFWPFLLRRWREVAPRRVVAGFDTQPAPDRSDDNTLRTGGRL